MGLNIGSRPAVKRVKGIITTTAQSYGGSADPFTTKQGSIQGLEVKGGADTPTTDETGKKVDRNKRAK